MFSNRNSCLAGSLEDQQASTLEHAQMADRQPDPKSKEPPMPHAHDMNPRPDRMDDEREQSPEDSEVEPEPSDKPRYRS
jgi:hypothetical protein